MNGVIDFEPTYAGDGKDPKYRSIIKEDGQIELVEDGYFDTYAYTQSFHDSADINVIVQRFMAGDVNALNQRQGFYGDVIEMPKTRQEAFQQLIDAEESFKQLPVAVKESFGNSFENYWMNAGSKEWLEKMAPVFGVEKSIESENKE